MATILNLNFEELQKLHDLGKLTKDDFLVQSQNGRTFYHNVILEDYPAFKTLIWLYKNNFVTRENLLVKDKMYGRTVFHHIIYNEEDDDIAIILWAYFRKLIKKEDLFIKDGRDKTMLDYLDEEDKKRLLEIFDQKE